MALLDWFNNFRVRLSSQERATIWKVFGSFQANQFAMQGTSIIENTYERNVEVYAIIDKIIKVTKSIPWVVEEKQRDGSWEKLQDSTLHELMDKPNQSKQYTWNDIEEQVLLYLLTTGNSYLYGETQFNSNLIQELDILPTPCVRIKSNNNFFLPEYNYHFYIGTTNRTIEKNQLAHIKFFNPGYSDVNCSLYGLSPIQVAARTIQVSNDRWEADANLLQNRGAIGLISDKSERPMTPDEAAKVQEGFDRDTAGTHNFGRVKVTNKDLAYIPMAMSSSDLQLIEKGVITLRSLCNVFGLDSSLFNDPENKTYNNRKEAEKSMYTNAIMPISDKISEHFTKFLCANHFPGRQIRMRQDFSGIEILQENFKEKAEINVSLKKAGIITANEARKNLNLPEIDEEEANSLIIDTTIPIQPIA